MSMTRVIAKTSFVAGGRVISPGPAEVPTTHIKRLELRGLIEPVKETVAPKNDGLDVFAELGTGIVGSLRDAGLRSVSDVAALAECQLIALPRIGKATARKIIEITEGASDGNHS